MSSPRFRRDVGQREKRRFGGAWRGFSSRFLACCFFSGRGGSVSFAGSNVTAEASCTFTLPPAQYAALVGAYGNPTAAMTVERRAHDPRPRALWGATRRHVQVGSPQDADSIERLSFPRVEFETVPR